MSAIFELSDGSLLHHYYVDESGDGVIFDGRGRVLVGTGTVQVHFTLGMVECSGIATLAADLARLRSELLADPYFKGVPSMQPAAGKTAVAFHAKDAMPARNNVGLQLADYCLWAVQRLFSRREDRFLGLIWSKVALLVDADDISERPYGTYHTRKHQPLDIAKLKNRKVED